MFSFIYNKSYHLISLTLLNVLNIFFSPPLHALNMHYKKKCTIYLFCCKFACITIKIIYWILIELQYYFFRLAGFMRHFKIKVLCLQIFFYFYQFQSFIICIKLFKYQLIIQLFSLFFQVIFMLCTFILQDKQLLMT